MKKQILKTTLLLALLIPCVLYAHEEERDIKNFNGVSFNLPGELYITQGNTYSVRITGPEDIVKLVVTEKRDGNLVIKTKENNNRKNYNDIVVYVTLPEMYDLSLAGSGDVFVNKHFKTSDLEVSVAGSGDVIFHDLEANDVELSLAGSGDIELHGKSMGEIEISIAGSGDVKADDFETKSAEISIAGSGSAKVFATEDLETSIIGSGSVYYKGNPLIDASAIGSGSTRKL